MTESRPDPRVGSLANALNNAGYDRDLYETAEAEAADLLAAIDASPDLALVTSDALREAERFGQETALGLPHEARSSHSDVSADLRAALIQDIKERDYQTEPVPDRVLPLGQPGSKYDHARRPTSTYHLDSPDIAMGDRHYLLEIIAGRDPDADLPRGPMLENSTAQVAAPSARAETIHDMAEEAIRLIETGENRAMAADGPVPHFRGELDDIEWRRLWLALSGLRAALLDVEDPK